MSDIEVIESRLIRFQGLNDTYKRACEHFDDYQLRVNLPDIQIRKKGKNIVGYTTNLSVSDLGLVGKCTCKSFKFNTQSVCKHVFVVALKMLDTWLHDKPYREWEEPLRYALCTDIETLLTAPGLKRGLLRKAHAHFTKDPKMTEDPVIKVVESTAWEDAAKTVAKKYEKGVEKRAVEPKPIPESTQRAIDIAEDMVPVSKTKAVTVPDKAFGGTYKDIPKNLVMQLGGKPYVTKSGLVYAASRMGLKSITTEPVKWSWDNPEKMAVFHATVTFENGRTFSSYGIAIPDGENVKMKQMFPFVDHLAETRAIGRALRNAMAFRAPSVEEMPDYRSQEQ